MRDITESVFFVTSLFDTTKIKEKCNTNLKYLYKDNGINFHSKLRYGRRVLDEMKVMT